LQPIFLLAISLHCRVLGGPYCKFLQLVAKTISIDKLEDRFTICVLRSVERVFFDKAQPIQFSDAERMPRRDDPGGKERTGLQ
jgi:hypothetical protein